MSQRELSDTVQSAFENFEGHINDADLSLFRSTQLKDVHEAIHVIEQEQEQCRRMRNLKRIEPFLERLGKLGDAIAAPLKLFLQIADEYDESFKQLLRAYSEISRRLPPIDDLFRLLGVHPNFSLSITELCDDILDLHAQSYLLLRRGGWKTLFNAAWKDFSTLLDATLQRIDLTRGFVERQIVAFAAPPASGNVYSSTEISGNAKVHQGNVYNTNITAGISPELSHLVQQNLTETSSLRKTLIEDFERKEKEKKDWRIRECIVWLELDGFDRDQDVQYSKRVDSREDHTCEWILTHNLLKKWLDHDDRRKYLWLKGKPGSGKTTLATYILDKAPFPPASLALFCLCSQSFGSSKSDSCGLLFRSLIAQALRKYQSGAIFVYEEYVKTAELPSVRNLLSILRTLLGCVPSAYIVIDGLDECDREAQHLIIKKLDSILAVQAEGDVAPISEVKILFCSRDTKAIPQRLRKEPTISLTQESVHVSKDIKVYTLKNIAELRDRFSEAEINDIATEIVAKANGMFLWVRLVVNSLLDQDSLDDLQNALRLLPKGLKALYQAILKKIEQRVDDRQQMYVRGIFTWLALSRRPLKTWELCDAVALSGPYQRLTSRSKLGKGILDHCKPLLEEDSDETVSFVHLSVKEFLLIRASGPYVEPVGGRRLVAAACVRYLLGCEDFFANRESPESYRNVVAGLHDFFPYVHEYWDQHVLKLTTCENTIGNTEKSLGSLAKPSDGQVALTLNDTPVIVAEASKLLSDVSLEFPPASFDRREMVDQVSNRGIGVSINMIVDKAQAVEQDTLAAASFLTPIDLAYQCFRRQFETLLQSRTSHKIAEMGISNTDMTTFCTRHATGAFLCFSKGCPRSIHGFDSAESREKHMDKHSNPFRCPDPSCEFANGNLASRAALKRHVVRYHTTSTEVMLPKFPISRVQGFRQSDAAPAAPSQEYSNGGSAATVDIPRISQPVSIDWTNWLEVFSPTINIEPAPVMEEQLRGSSDELSPSGQRSTFADRSNERFKVFAETVEDLERMKRRTRVLYNSCSNAARQNMVEEMDNGLRNAFATSQINPVLYRCYMTASDELGMQVEGTEMIKALIVLSRETMQESSVSFSPPPQPNISTTDQDGYRAPAVAPSSNSPLVRPNPAFNKFCEYRRLQLKEDDYPQAYIQSRIDEEWRILSDVQRGFWVNYAVPAGVASSTLIPTPPSSAIFQFRTFRRLQLKAYDYSQEHIDLRLDEEWGKLSAEIRAFWVDGFLTQMREYEEAIAVWDRAQRMQAPNDGSPRSPSSNLPTAEDYAIAFLDDSLREAFDLENQDLGVPKKHVGALKTQQQALKHQDTVFMKSSHVQPSYISPRPTLQPQVVDATKFQLPATLMAQFPQLANIDWNSVAANSP